MYHLRNLWVAQMSHQHLHNLYTILESWYKPCLLSPLILLSPKKQNGEEIVKYEKKTSIKFIVGSYNVKKHLQSIPYLTPFSHSKSLGVNSKFLCKHQLIMWLLASLLSKISHIWFNLWFNFRPTRPQWIPLVKYILG